MSRLDPAYLAKLDATLTPGEVGAYVAIALRTGRVDEDEFAFVALGRDPVMPVDVEARTIFAGLIIADVIEFNPATGTITLTGRCRQRVLL